MLDTTPVKYEDAQDGLWVMGNRFIAAGREMFIWLPRCVVCLIDVRRLQTPMTSLPLRTFNRMKTKYVNHRSYYFLVENSLGAMYQAYKESLDYSIDYAMDMVSP